MSRPARLRRGAPWIAAATALTLGFLSAGPAAQADRGDLNKHPMGTTHDPQTGQGRGGANGGSRIQYHGGPIMLGPTTAYVIWYGGWGSSATPALVSQLLGGDIGGSSYFNINTTYTDGSGRPVTNAVRLGGSASVGYTKGTVLSDANVQQVVAETIANGALPMWTPAGPVASTVPDPTGVYFVLTSQDVSESSGFLTSYCGWHTYATVGGVDTKYAFVGDASRNLGACAVQTTVSPNNNPAGDAMLSVIAHELEEAVTDPDLNAWYDNRGMENADKCAWTFGATSQLSNGALYNMTMNGHRYLIQQNWLNRSKGSCAVAY